MFIADIPNVPPSTPAVVMVAQANTNQKAATQREHTLGVCKLVNPSGTGQADLSPLTFANGYLNTYNTKIDRVTAVISVLQQPKHGHLEPDSGGNWVYAKYLPDADYLGDDPGALKDDSFVMKVEGNGYVIKIHYFIAITDNLGVEFNPNPVCKEPYWIISSTLDTNSTIASVETSRPPRAPRALQPLTLHWPRLQAQEEKRGRYPLYALVSNYAQITPNSICRPSTSRDPAWQSSRRHFFHR